ncbi:MAG: hypothetical protein V1740_01940 [Candidatus Woesearchaeota archaeon]
MIKNNYITREEQRIWEYIKDKEIIDNELVRDIFPEMKENKRNKLLHNLYKKDYLKRARKDLYYNPELLKDFYRLALKIRESYIGLSSALRYYNLIEYEDFTIFVMTENFQKNLEIRGTQYDIKFIPLKSMFKGFEKHNNIYVSSIEKTLFDCLLKPRFVGLSNITKAFYDAKIDWNKFISFFKETKNDSLCQRTGYLLEMVKKKTNLKIPSFVFEDLLKSVKNPVKLMPYSGKSYFNRKWMVQDNAGEKNILSWWH